MNAENVCVALDRPNVGGNLRLVEALVERAKWFKVGLRTWAEGGEPLLRAVTEGGGRLFLDLKFHDIPATVEGACRRIARWQPDLITVHASGGHEMMRAARTGLAEGGAERTRVVGVTVLTSLDRAALATVGVPHEPAEWAARLAQAARDAELDGVVCSGHEVASVRAAWPDGFFVVPGIRPQSATTADDQKRTMTPAAALREGASLLVIGRPIHAADDPRVAWDTIMKEFS